MRERLEQLEDEINAACQAHDLEKANVLAREHDIISKMLLRQNRQNTGDVVRELAQGLLDVGSTAANVVAGFIDGLRGWPPRK